jgi:hypothetical protein
VFSAILAGRATENEKWSRRAFGAPEAVPAALERRLAVTETRSPATNGRLGENAVPWLSGCALSRPACIPLRDPTTLTDAIWSGETAGKSTLVAAEASGVPGNGNTSSPCDAEAAWEAWCDARAPECVLFATAPDPPAIPMATTAPIVAPAPTARFAGRGKALPDIPDNMYLSVYENRQRKALATAADPPCILRRALGRARSSAWYGAAQPEHRRKTMRVDNRPKGSQ